MSFENLGLSPALLGAVQKRGFTNPTPIQEKSIPLLQQGKDIIAQSETGSGKTFAFALPILDKVRPKQGLQALVLTPTRELARQIKQECDTLHTGMHIDTVYGGVGFEPQIQALRHSEMIVATPGRMLDHLRSGAASLGKVKYLVLDEADRMLEMGFIEDVQAILQFVPKERQTMMFSATMPFEIVKLSQKYLKNPTEITTKPFVDTKLLKQVYVDCMDNEKFSLLVHLVRNYQPERAMVFCGRRRTADLVTSNLQKQGVRAESLHGGHTQAKREHVLDSFHQGRMPVLVATDVASRGLDIKGVTHVFNYDAPNDPSDYTHRIGRTARAGEKGKAVSLIAPIDYDNFRKVTAVQDVEQEVVEQFPRIPFHTRSEGEAPQRRFGGGRRGGPHQRSGGRREPRVWGRM